MVQLNSDSKASTHRYLTGPLAIFLYLACFASGLVTSRLIFSDERDNGLNASLGEKVDNLQSSIDGRLENLSRAVFDVQANLLRVPPIPTNNLPVADAGPVEPTESVADLLQRADKLRTDKKLQAAEILLTRAVQTNRDDVSAWRALATIQRDMAARSIAAGELMTAAQQADRALVSVNGIKSLSISPSSPSVDPTIVHDEEVATDKTIKAVRDAIDQYCATPIAAAETCAADAWHWYWWNSRDIAVEGLKNLKNVIELGPWASEQTRISANDAFSKLKHLVTAEEWNDLLARAGFDPGSRDTLKKWGLE